MRQLFGKADTERPAIVRMAVADEGIPKSVWAKWADQQQADADRSSWSELAAIVDGWGLSAMDANRLLDLVQGLQTAYVHERHFTNLHGSPAEERKKIIAIGKRSAQLANLIETLRPDDRNIFAMMQDGWATNEAHVLNMARLVADLQATARAAIAATKVFKVKRGPPTNFALDKLLAELIPALETVTGLKVTTDKESDPQVPGPLGAFLTAFLKILGDPFKPSTLATAVTKPKRAKRSTRK